MALRDTPGKTVAVLTTQHRLQTLLETAAAAGRLIAFDGRLITGSTPIGSAFAVDAKTGLPVLRGSRAITPEDVKALEDES